MTKEVAITRKAAAKSIYSDINSENNQQNFYGDLMTGRSY